MKMATIILIIQRERETDRQTEDRDRNTEIKRQKETVSN